MKFTRADFACLRRELSGMAAAVLVGGIVLYASDRYAQAAQKERRAAQHGFELARAQLSGARDDRDNLAAYAGAYEKLAESGIIGDGHRLDWVEGMEHLRRQNIVMNFSYSIAPQTSYAAPQPLDSGNFDVRHSEMKLHFDLLHEVQLVNFLDALHGQVKGRYQLQGCTLQRSAASSGLGATCSGGWITLSNRSEAP